MLGALQAIGSRSGHKHGMTGLLSIIDSITRGTRDTSMLAKSYEKGLAIGMVIGGVMGSYPRYIWENQKT